MSDETFLRLSRRFFSNPLWEEPRAYSRAEAWLDLMHSAAWDDHRRVIAGAMVQVKRGGVFASVRYLATRWQWSKTKVAAFLELLEKEEMITISKGQQNTTIFLCNFSQYNPKKGQREDTQRTPKGQQLPQKKDTERTASNSETEKTSAEKKDTERTVAFSESAKKKDERIEVIEEGELGTGRQPAPAPEETSSDHPPGWEPPLKMWVAECARYLIPAWYAEKKWEVFGAKGWAIGKTPAVWRKLVPLAKRDFTNDGSPMTEAGAAPNPGPPEVNGKRPLVYQGESPI